MTEQAPRRERQDAVKNRARILETAHDLFARHGVESVSMNRIAQEAEVGAGTLYRHFGSKSDLCFALMQDHLMMLADELAALAVARDDAHPTLERMTLRYLQFKEQKIPLFKGMEQSALSAAGPLQSPVYERLHEPFSALFERAGCDDAPFRADMLLAAFISGSPEFQQTARGLSLEEFARKTCELFLPRASQA